MSIAVSLDDLSIFNTKFNEGMERIDSILSTDYNPKPIKNYLDRYKLEKSREERLLNKSKNGRDIISAEKRKQIVDIYEIRKHEKKVQQYQYQNYLKNEIEWFKLKKREDEYKYNMNKQKFQNDQLEKISNKKNEIKNNSIKMKEFSKLVNKVNIDRLEKKRKFNSISANINNNNENNNNDVNQNFEEGEFIPYSEYEKAIKQNKEIYNANNKNFSKIPFNNLKKINTNQKIKTNKVKSATKKNVVINQDNVGKKLTTSTSIKTFKTNNNNLNYNRYNIDKRKPLDKPIDYLHNGDEKIFKEPKKKVYENKTLLKDKNAYLKNVELLNYESKKYENQAMRQEELMRVKGKINSEDNNKLSNLLIDSISAKLALLNQMTNNS